MPGLPPVLPHYTLTVVEEKKFVDFACVAHIPLLQFPLTTEGAPNTFINRCNNPATSFCVALI